MSLRQLWPALLCYGNLFFANHSFFFALAIIATFLSLQEIIHFLPDQNPDFLFIQEKKASKMTKIVLVSRKNEMCQNGQKSRQNGPIFDQKVRKMVQNLPKMDQTLINEAK